jgi:putative peptidoglycan lipid II flippase
MAPAFYALDRARVPVVASILGMVVNVGLNLALYPVLGFRGVALGTSLAAGANLAVLLLAWRREHGGLGEAGLLPQLARVLAASAVLAAVAWGTAAILEAALPPGGLWRQALVGLAPVIAGAVAYFGVARLLGVEELHEVVAALRRKASSVPE